MAISALLAPGAPIISTTGTLSIDTFAASRDVRRASAPDFGNIGAGSEIVALKGSAESYSDFVTSTDSSTEKFERRESVIVSVFGSISVRLSS
ncbi:unnamed protein product [Haemonchus placei]|uniref:Uncharacterized protein n=1 Tax=Haemonchus placei TaxID=6290 RepID=A0A3P8BAT1_HAEPC|nr:unnamed protein product [Haemonchus placei]